MERSFWFRFCDGDVGRVEEYEEINSVGAWTASFTLLEDATNLHAVFLLTMYTTYADTIFQYIISTIFKYNSSQVLDFMKILLFAA